MIVIHKIKMDLQEKSVTPRIDVVQGDAGSRAVELTLYSGGTAWDVPEDVTVSMRYKKSDRTKGYYDTMPDGTPAWNAEGNVLTVRLAPQMLTAAGAVLAQAEILQGTDLLATFAIQVYVNPNPAAGALRSEDYFNWLQWMERELDAYLEQMKKNGEYAGGKMLDTIDMDGNKLCGLPAPEEDDEAANKAYADTKLPLDGTASMAADLPMGNHRVVGMAQPKAASDGVNKGYVDAAVKAAAPCNLLDNSDFANPVNQRGATSYAAIGYCLDRWRLNASTVSVTVGAGSVTIARTGTVNASFTQFLSTEKTPAAGEIVTAACEDAAGNIYVGSGAMPESGYIKLTDIGSGAAVYLYAPDSTYGARLALMMTAVGEISLKWIALYRGQYTKDTLPEYRPRGYGAELAECQRYYFCISLIATAVAGIAVAPATTYAILPVALPVKPLSGIPTITADAAQFTLRNAGTAAGEITELGTYNMAGNTIMLRIVGTGFTAGETYYLRATTKQVIAFSWEL